MAIGNASSKRMSQSSKRKELVGQEAPSKKPKLQSGLCQCSCCGELSKDGLWGVKCKC